MARLDFLLVAGVLIAVALALISAGIAGYQLARRRGRPHREALRQIGELTPELLRQRPPANRDRLANAALTRIWALTEPVVARQRQLLEQNSDLQRRYGQARALIDLMAEFNETMQLTAVLDRLSSGLSRFFAGDGVAIWVRAPQGQFELAAKVASNFPATLSPHDRWVSTVMAGDAGLLLPPSWLDSEMPCMAAPLLDAQAQRIGIVALTSRLRAAYTVEDGAFLRTVIGHAAMAIQNATMYQFIDTLSRIDALTGLNNRREFDRVLALEIGRSQQTGQPLSLIVIDIDHFKAINDKFGHQEGDRTLQQVARIIQVVPKRVTDAAFRTGGEEFAILMSDTDKTGAMALSESLRNIAEQAQILGPDQPVTLSLGVATFPLDAADPVRLISAADRALYQAKRGGRNRVEAA